MRLFPTLLAVLILAGGALLAAITAPGPAHVSFAELEQYRAGGVPDERWPALMETLGSDEQRAAVRSLIKDLKPFPAAKLVEMLAHPRLAARLGALEVLEDAAGETFGFDPWQEAAAEGGNVEALQRWKKWATSGKAEPAADTVKLTDETFRVIALEITSGKPERAERAMRRLENFGVAGISAIESFLQSQAGLEELPKAMLKQAEYRLLIAQSLPRQAAALARDLAVGSPEAQSTALSALSAGGSAMLPIFSDFLVSADPLVRESAVDAAFTAGGKNSVSIIAAIAPKETAESVLHAILKGLGRFGTTAESTNAIAKFLSHPSENVVVGAVEALGFSKSAVSDDALKKCLTDPRWRVRAAGLETIAKRRVTSCKDAVIVCLNDPEIFVRVTAVSTLMTTVPQEAEAPLLEQFEKQHDLKAPIIMAFFKSSKKEPPARLWSALQSAPPETILQCLDTLEDRDDRQGKRAVHAAQFANHANQDVSAAALQILAHYGHATALLVGALNGADPVKKDAVLDQLRLPAGFFKEIVQAPAGNSTPKTGSANPKLDLLYTRMRVIGPTTNQAAKVSDSETPTVGDAAAPAEIAAALVKILQSGSPRQRLRAAINLAPSGAAPAFEHLSAVVETLPAVDRRGIAGALSAVTDWKPCWNLAIRLLRDSADDVRETAIESWLEVPTSERITGLLDEVSRTGSSLNPAEIYNWEFDRMLEKAESSAAIVGWAQRVLADPSTRDAVKAFAVVCVERAEKTGELNLAGFVKSQNPILRRVAYRALGLKHAEERLADILADNSALVRMAVPFLTSPTNGAWEHYFDDASYVKDSRDYNSSSNRRTFGAWAGKGDHSATASEAMIAAVEKLARDPSERVKFESMLALMRLGRAVDPSALASVVASQAPEVHARRRLGDLLENSYTSLGKGYGVLLPLAEDISEHIYSKLVAHFGIQEGNVATTFATLAKLKPSEAKRSDVAVGGPVPASSAKIDGTFRVLFFHKVGCKDCERVREMLARHSKSFPSARIEEHDIEDSESAILNEALSTRFNIKDTLHQVAPSVFTQTGALVRDDLTFPALGDLLRSTDAAPRDENWAHVEAAEVAAVESKITERYEALSLWVVGTVGLLDGLNPCAFATIIFLISYLQVARRSPREILAVGAAFICAVFLSYFLVGLGLFQVFARLNSVRFVGAVLNYGLAGLALVLALFCFRDAQLASRGQFGEMTLQLPGSIKEQIRSAIRTSTKSSRFVVAAFVAGIAISLLELACTGQVYLPTIQLMLKSGRASAAGYLLVYNLAFIVPLAAVFGLAWAGKRSDAFIRFQQKNIALVKVLTGIIFLLLTLFLLYGHVLIPALTGKK